MNTIVMTCYQRPEFLKVCLECLMACPELPEYRIHFFPDFGHDPGNFKVIKWFQEQNPNMEVKVTERTKRMHPVLASYNIMTSYQLATVGDEDYLIICEEDTFMTADFLRFNHSNWENFLKRFPRIFCVAHKRRPVTEEPGDPTIMIGDPQCTSPTCITREAAETYMFPLFGNDHYFMNPSAYFAEHYPNSRLKPHELCDHDGAIERIIEANNLFAIKPDHARTMHAGFSGGHRDSSRSCPRLGGTIDEKAERIRQLIMNPTTLKGMMVHPPQSPNWRHVTCIDLAAPEWDHLELDLDRDKAKSSEWYFDPDNRFAEYIRSETH